LEPTVGGLAEERLRYRGVIFVGLMLTDKGPRVLEYNVRLGDPETQALLPLLKSDLLPMLRAAAEGRLEAVQPVWRKEVAVTVVAASGGYPGSYERGFSIGGIDPPASRNALWEREGLPVPFVAGAELSPSGELQTAGGRVVAVTALGATIEEAREEAYNRLSRITFRGIYYRRDIPFLGE
jgi:phosphoribosylamine--glycine ligase